MGHRYLDLYLFGSGKTIVDNDVDLPEGSLHHCLTEGSIVSSRGQCIDWDFALTFHDSPDPGSGGSHVVHEGEILVI